MLKLQIHNHHIKPLRFQCPLQNESGNAVLESIPLLIVFVVLLGFGFGLFGSIHTAILHSISARHYAFETFRNRTNLTYFRENLGGLSSPNHFQNIGIRYHAIVSERSQDVLQFIATERPIYFGQPEPRQSDNVQTHNEAIYTIAARNDRVSVHPMWIMVGYGICINSKCGD